MSAIDEPQNARSRRTRAALLDAARTIIETGADTELTMSAIADIAGVSRRATYLHFANRGDLLAALLEHVGETEGLAESLARVWDCPDACSALVEWCHHQARAHTRILAIGVAVEVARHSDQELAVVRDAIMDRWLRGCRRLVGWLDDDGVLAEGWTVETAADLLWGLMSWDLVERLVVDRGWSRDDLGTRLATLALATLVDASPDPEQELP